MGARGGGEQQRAVGDRLLHGVEQLDLVQDVIRAGGGALRAEVGPAVARIDDAQPREAKIAHRTRGHADVLAELRLDQDHDGAGQIGRRSWSCRCLTFPHFHYVVPGAGIQTTDRCAHLTSELLIPSHRCHGGMGPRFAGTTGILRLYRIFSSEMQNQRSDAARLAFAAAFAMLCSPLSPPRNA